MRSFLNVSDCVGNTQMILCWGIWQTPTSKRWVVVGQTFFSDEPECGQKVRIPMEMLGVLIPQPHNISLRVAKLKASVEPKYMCAWAHSASFGTFGVTLDASAAAGNRRYRIRRGNLQIPVPPIPSITYRGLPYAPRVQHQLLHVTNNGRISGSTGKRTKPIKFRRIPRQPRQDTI